MLIQLTDTGAGVEVPKIQKVLIGSTLMRMNLRAAVFIEIVNHTRVSSAPTAKKNPLLSIIRSAFYLRPYDREMGHVDKWRDPITFHI